MPTRKRDRNRFTRTVFRIASVSKTFVAVAIMQLAEQGIIDLQADIREYIPDLQFENPFDTPVTVEHLLLHKSGFEVRDPHMDDYYFDRSLSLTWRSMCTHVCRMSFVSRQRLYV